MTVEDVAMESFYQISMAREVSAAVVNVSGRQRMLSQRIALFSLRLVCSQNSAEREKLSRELSENVALMEKSHNGLIEGDVSMKLPGHPSRVTRSMYFEPPLNLDRKVRDYIQHVRAILSDTDAELTIENPHLKYILNVASAELLAALDAVVSQYQKESEVEQLALERKQIELYKQSCAATAAARSRALELQQTLQDLQKAQSQLIQSEKMSSLGQLLAGVAHEINNPVTFIYGNLSHATNYVRDLLKLLTLYQQCYPNAEPEIEEFIASVETDFIIEDLPKVMSSMKMGADRIRQLVLSLRNFSRIDRVEMTSMDIHEGIENTLLILQNRLKPQPNHCGIQVIKEYGALPKVQCYAGQLNQVFMNILANAIDALETQSKPGVITIRTEVKREINSQKKAGISSRLASDFPPIASSVVICISDNGPGIPEEVKEQVFQAFFTTKPIGQGTGLGLSISYQIVVEKHGGSIECVSSPGQGTAFWIELPVRQSHQLSAIDCETSCRL